ncbi:universal stress protein [Streptomyces lunaelactis]|nr:universal stress protein [Streptomyces lunaelactis]NUK88585.1 universal stress protein [Streptomyces lunaelactis]
MTRTVTVGLDGSPESHAAAEWAAREAKMRGLPLRLVNVWEPVPPLARAPLLGEETQQHWAERSEMGAPTAGGRGRIPREAAEALRLSRQLAAALLVVVGRRIRRSPFGTHIGPVTHAVLHHATAPVVVIPHP